MSNNGNINKVLEHIHQRFNELETYLGKHTNAIVTIYGENNTHRLLTRQARYEWLKLDPNLNKIIQTKLDEHVNQLMNKFNRRININNINEPIDASHIIVFGTNESDWNKPDGQMINSINMIQKIGLYGIVTMPTTNITQLKVNPITWNHDAIQFLNLLKQININKENKHQVQHQQGQHQVQNKQEHQVQHQQEHQVQNKQVRKIKLIHNRISRSYKKSNKKSNKKATKYQCKKHNKRWVKSHKISRNGKHINVKGYCRSK